MELLKLAFYKVHTPKLYSLDIRMDIFYLLYKRMYVYKPFTHT